MIEQIHTILTTPPPPVIIVEPGPVAQGWLGGVLVLVAAAVIAFVLWVVSNRSCA